MRNKDRAHTERAFITAARKIFSEKGYENSTTKEIATVAGCNEALIQRYFNGKDGLLLAVFDSRMSKAKPLEFETVFDSDSLEGELIRIFEAAREDLQGRSDELRIVLSRILVDHEFYQRFLQLSSFSEYEKVLENLLVHCQEKGRIGLEIDVKNASSILMDAIFQICFFKTEVLQLPDSNVVEHIRYFCRIFSKGLENA